jgi:hypothetical protein
VAQGPTDPLFTSSKDLDVKLSLNDPTVNDPNFKGFPRIGDYTSADCSSQIGWVVWTDLRDGFPSIYGALIPLAP